MLLDKWIGGFHVVCYERGKELGLCGAAPGDLYLVSPNGLPSLIKAESRDQLAAAIKK